MAIDKSTLLAQMLGEESVSSGIFDALDKKKSKQDRYRNLMRGGNMYSYSVMSLLNACERKLQITKLENSRPGKEMGIQRNNNNIDFAFGKAVESGVHAVLLGKAPHLVYFDMFQAWDVPLLMQHPKGKAKSFIDAWVAVEKFAWIKDNMFQGWEIAYFNGKPAIELSLCVDMENGYYYCGHVDVVMWNPIENRYRVLEIKTTGLKWTHEAMYKNSGQASGYSIILDSIVEDLEATSTYEVFYLMFSTETDQWVRYDFTYSRSSRASWINTILLDINRIDTYRTINFYPKRGGSSCLDYGKPCAFFGVCDLSAESFNGTGEFDTVTEEEIAAQSFDFRFTLGQIIRTQQELI